MKATTRAITLCGMALMIGLLTGSRARAASETTDPEQAYQECMTLAGRDPSAAFEAAGGWIKQGGGYAARHCQAAALMGMTRYTDAGKQLEALAVEVSRGKPDIGVRLMAEAGQAWILAKDYPRAVAVFTSAIKIAPKDPDLLIDRAVALSTAENYWEAIDDLNQAVRLAPRRAEPLVLRASAYRLVGALDLATDDVERALALDPRNADALVERGGLRRLKGDARGARADWMAAIRAQPDGPSGDIARANLEKMDVKTAP
jgi:Flp pilus assembly protein TadD